MLRSPLSVRVASDAGDIHITRIIDDVEFSTAAYGGFDTCSFDLDKPIDDAQGVLAVESKVYIYDARNGLVVWEGRLTDPGRSYDQAGHKWSMTAMGPKKHASDRFSPYIAIDSDLGAWRQTFTPIAESGATLSSVPGETSDDSSCMLLQFQRGVAVAAGDVISMRHDMIRDAGGQQLGAFRYTHQEGQTNTVWDINGGTRVGTTTTMVRNHDFDLSVRTIGAIYTDEMGTNQTSAVIRIARDGIATNVSGDNVWAAVTSFYVTAKLYKKDGTFRTGSGAYPTGYLTSDWIVADILVRFCPLFDAANATIDVTTYQIDQFAYPSGARPSDLFDDLLMTNPDKRWAAWETNPATGLYKFEFTGWGTAPRYEATVADGIDLPGSSADLYNRVTVQGVDARGRTKSTIVTSVVPALGTLVREADPIDLGAEVYSVANATQIGTQFLTQSAVPPASGTLTVKRPIRDLIWGRIVQPWEIRAGSLIRVRGLYHKPGSATVADRDGSSVFRVSATSFRDSDQSASLTLDTPSYTVEQLLARVARRRQRR